MSLVARGDHCVDVWADGKTRRGEEEGRGEELRRKTSSCLHPIEADPSVCSSRSIR